MATPFFPSLGLPAVDQHWFDADAAIDEEAELTQLEKDHQAWAQDIANQNSDLMPTGPEDYADEPEEEDESGPEDDEEESDTNEEEDDEEVEELDVH